MIKNPVANYFRMPDENKETKNKKVFGLPEYSSPLHVAVLPCYVWTGKYFLMVWLFPCTFPNGYFAGAHHTFP